MIRYQSHYQRKQLKKTFFLIFFLLVFLYFLFTLGIKIIIFTSSSIANFFYKKESVSSSKSNETIPGIIYLDTIPTATNSSTIIVTGSVENFDKLDAYLNNQKIKTAKINESSFELKIENLKEGNNELYIIAKNSKNNNQKKTDVYPIYYKKTKPKLEISSPKNEEKVNKEEILIKGQTDKEVIIEINNQPVVVNLNGEFESTIKLKEGENLIKVTAQDIAGNLEEKTLKLFYEKES